MAERTIKTRIMLKHDTAANWANTSVADKGANLVLKNGELAYDSTNMYIKFGDGEHTYSELPFIHISAANVDGLSDANTDTLYKLQVSKNQLSITLLSADKTGETYTAVETYALKDWTSEISAAEARALSDAEAYTNTVSAALSADYQEKIDAIWDDISSGIHFIGHVAEFGIDETTEKPWYALTEGGEHIEAKNGDLIIANNKEYIYSETAGKWDEFGDEGNYATKQYVDDAKAEAISATQNAVYVETDLADDAIATYKADATKNIGDILINKKTIAAGKFEHTAYVWNGTAWAAMDGNYSAENVYFKEDITLAGDYTAVGNIKLSDNTLPATGKSVKTLMDNIFTKEISSTATKPTFTLTVASHTDDEIGTNYTVPAATLKMTSRGSYTYTPTAANCSVEIGDGTVSCTTIGYTTLTAANTAAMVKDSTVSTSAGTENAETYLSTAVTYNYSASATYTDGVMPKTNLGNEQPDTQIKSATSSLTASATFTGKWPCYYAFTDTAKDAPTAITANGGNVTVDGVTYTRVLNDFAKTTFTTNGNWYQLYYLVPTAKQSNTKWSGVDKNNVDLPSKTSKTATVTFMDGTTAEYRVFIVSNAQPYQATTCTMKYSN